MSFLLPNCDKFVAAFDSEWDVLKIFGAIVFYIKNYLVLGKMVT
jgi:hypothetical protein